MWEDMGLWRMADGGVGRGGVGQSTPFPPVANTPGRELRAGDGGAGGEARAALSEDMLKFEVMALYQFEFSLSGFTSTTTRSAAGTRKRQP
jgi:hypothetical protein